MVGPPPLSVDTDTLRSRPSTSGAAPGKGTGWGSASEHTLESSHAWWWAEPPLNQSQPPGGGRGGVHSIYGGDDSAERIVSTSFTEHLLCARPGCIKQVITFKHHDKPERWGH